MYLIAASLMNIIISSVSIYRGTVYVCRIMNRAVQVLFISIMVAESSISYLSFIRGVVQMLSHSY